MPALLRREFLTTAAAFGTSVPIIGLSGIAHAATGETRVRLDQTMWGARWIKLGDFDLRRGEGGVTVEAAAPGHVAGGLLRVTRWSAQSR